MMQIADLAPDIPGGQAERLSRVVSELTLPVDERLADVSDLEIEADLPEPLLPPLWRALLEVLAGAGAAVSYAKDDPEQVREPQVILLKTPDEWEAADYAAAWLGARAQEKPGALSLLRGAGGGTLDRTLLRHGLPVTGSAERSAARWQLQLLPALIGTLWSPVNPHAIGEFLSLAAGMIRRDSAEAILNALARHPGVGGEQWEKAITSIRGRAGDKEADLLDRFFAQDLYDEHEGLPLSALAERMTWLRSRLGRSAGANELSAIAIGQTTALERALAIVLPAPGASVSRTLLESMLRSIVRPVSSGDPQSAAPWNVCTTIESVPPETKTLLWWNPIDEGRAARSRYSESEITTLRAHGYALERPAEARARLRFLARRVLQRGPREVLLMLPVRFRAEETAPHPIVEEFLLTAGSRAKTITTGSADREISLFGQSVSREIPVQSLPAPPTVVTSVAPGSIPLPQKLSYSAIHSLLGCPMQWTLSARGIGRTMGQELPGNNQMLGTLTHRIVEILVEEHLTDGTLPGESPVLAGQLFDELLPQMAAELLLPGNHLRRERARATVVSAVTKLTQTITNLGLRIVQSEQSLETSWPLTVAGSEIDMLLKGYADLELSDADGAPFVFDLKYSYGRSFYTKLVEKGEAIQLAVYTQLLHRLRGREARGAGYFLLPTGTVVTSAEIAGAQGVEAERTTAEVWKRTERAVAAALETVTVTGEITTAALLERETEADTRREEADERGEIYQEPPCRFCDFCVICGRDWGNA
jgi:hypothetical protein